MTRHRLLIVDDQPANVRVIAEVLREEYDILFATSGAKALEIASTSDIELILLDVVMPDLDGFEVCQRLKADEKTSRIPVIFVTAREEVYDETHGFDVGGVDYITKPIRPPVVRARVRTQLELKRTRDLLESLASIDALTGIANRRRFDVVLEEEWKRATRTRSQFSLALLDVDYFKKFNDTYGHARGDDCLRSIAQTLPTVARRPSDLAARYGGEEFGLVLPETDAVAMRGLMRRLVAAVHELGIEHRASSCAPHVSISGGAVTLVPSHEDGAAQALEAADRLLYEAKANGRDQVVHLDMTTGARERIALKDGVTA